LDDYLLPLDNDHHAIALKLCLLCWIVSNKVLTIPICPNKFQLKASIAAVKKCNCIIDVDTGYGKTLDTILPHLLLPLSISIVVSPLKRLQVLQVWSVSY
jgi:hypothetical protein